MLQPQAAHRVRLVSPPCTVGITDGSERGDYVPQAHLLQVLRRPHHVVNLMFQYYPDLAGWPTQGVKWHGFFRNNQLNQGDGYFPLVLEDGGPWGRLYLKQIEDVRAHGQEPQLTLTLHCDTADEVLVRIAQSLAPFGPMRIRINHECNGVWFYFNQRWSYKQVSDFFIRFHHILHEHAPLVKTVACFNGPGDAYKQPDPEANRGRLREDELLPMFRVADIVSFDQYASLHYGWPDPTFDPANPKDYFTLPFEIWWELLHKFHAQIGAALGRPVDVEIHEINEDAELIGYDAQAAWVTRFYNEALRQRLPWLTNITYYMFRDRGGLGLEQEDVDDPNRFRELPALAAYREAIADPYFGMRTARGLPVRDAEPVISRWRGPTDAEGAEYEFQLPPGATRFNLRLPAVPVYLVGTAGRWVVKESGSERVLLTIQDFKGGPARIHLFALPRDGRNNLSSAYVETIAKPPALEPAG